VRGPAKPSEAYLKKMRRTPSGDGGEVVDDHPKDPLDYYLRYKRFRAGGRTHVVRFGGPCT
jgi:hypothetical protein